VKSGIAGEYVGRAMRGRAGSVLGNPYRMRVESERGAAIERYAAWLRERVALPNSVEEFEIRRLRRILERDGRLVLLCWCAPKPCHADVVAAFISRNRDW
jgi:hypothetical protein